MRRLANLHLLTFALLFVSMPLLVWGYYPSQIEHKSLRIPGVGQQNLTWTSRIRAGEKGFVRLEFQSAVSGLGGFSLLGDQRNAFHSIHQLPLNTSNHVLAETRIELPGVILDPGEELIQPLIFGKSLSFTWWITPKDSGNVEGEIWFYIKNISQDQNEAVRQPISVINIHTRSVDLLGMNGQTARIFGIIGVCIALFSKKDSVTKLEINLKTGC